MQNISTPCGPRTSGGMPVLATAFTFNTRYDTCGPGRGTRAAALSVPLHRHAAYALSFTIRPVPSPTSEGGAPPACWRPRFEARCRSDTRSYPHARPPPAACPGTYLILFRRCAVEPVWFALRACARSSKQAHGSSAPEPSSSRKEETVDETAGGDAGGWGGGGGGGRGR